MSKEKWTEQKSRTFVLSYLRKPSLWDSSCSEYCQKTEVIQASLILSKALTDFLNFRKNDHTESYRMNSD